MSNKKFLEFLFPDQPFFEGATDGIQGAPICHIFMSAAVSLKATESSSLSILEVGSWTGSSTLTWCEALKTYCLESGKILCVDPWISYFSSEQREQGSQYKLMAAMANLDFTYDIFQHNINFISPNVKVDHMRGKSDDILPYLKDNQFDLMYIDGDHSYKNSLFDIQSAKRLVKVGGFICGDDLEVQGSECDLNFIRDNSAIDYVEIPELDAHATLVLPFLSMKNSGRFPPIVVFGSCVKHQRLPLKKYPYLTKSLLFRSIFQTMQGRRCKNG